MLCHSGVACQPVDGHLDGQHLGVIGSFPEQTQEGLHRLIGIEEQGIPLLDLGPEGIVLGEIVGIDGGIFRIVEGAVALVQLIGILEHQRTGTGIGLLGSELELLFQQLADLRGIALHFQPHRSQTAPLAQRLDHVVPEILALFVIEPGFSIVDVGVPGHRNNALLGDVIGLEDLPQLEEDHFLSADILGILPGQQDNGRQGFGYFHDAQQGAVPSREHGGSIEPLVPEMGEGGAAVDDLGREQREDPVPVPVLDIGAVLALQFLGLPFPDTLVLQLGRDLGKGGVPVADQRTHRFIDGFQLLLGGQTALAVGLFGEGELQVGEASHPHHEEFIQVACEDGEEPQAFQQRDMGVHRLIHDPGIELEPAQFPVLGIA